MILRMFGIGTAKAVAGEKTEGVVTRVMTCWWLKVNTKSVRMHMADGAAFPHIIHFEYTVNGQIHHGKRYVHYKRRCPVKEERLTVYFEKEAPGKYAVIL